MLTRQVYNLSGLDRVEEISIQLDADWEFVKIVVVTLPLVMVVGMFISLWFHSCFHFNLSHY